jgi:hypothetical protein
MSSAKEIAERLAKRKRVYPVTTDEGVLHVRGMNGTERNDYFNSITSEGNDSEKLIANQKLIARYLCNEDGSPAFEKFEEALAVVLQWDIPHAVKPMVDQILKASGLGEGAQDEAEKK